MNTGKFVTKVVEVLSRCSIVALVFELDFCVRKSDASFLAIIALG